jgi:phosphatidylserine/phosphatidylglycerophosphate/cardiolipin synthase-like enzyme
LLSARRSVIAKWNAGRAKANKQLEDMRIMHLFIVTPVPERSQMIPRTYDALAPLGQHDAMKGQVELIDEINKQKPRGYRDEFGVRGEVSSEILPAIQHANAIRKPGAAQLEDEFGIRVCTAMLNTCGLVNGGWRYREIYIHSKLMLIDDTYFTLGSANLNQRSMVVDSEINITVVDPFKARNLRQRVWEQLSRISGIGGTGKQEEISAAFKKWRKNMDDNRARQNIESGKAEDRQMLGFILPLVDNRKSTLRLG